MADLLRVNYLIYMHALNVKFLGSYLFYVLILILIQVLSHETAVWAICEVKSHFS